MFVIVLASLLSFHPKVVSAALVVWTQDLLLLIYLGIAQYLGVLCCPEIHTPVERPSVLLNLLGQ